MPAREFFDSLPGRADAGKIAGIENSYLFDIAGEGRWLVDISGGALTVSEPSAEEAEDADVTIATSSETFDRIVAGDQSPTMAYMTGKIKVSGDSAAALKLQKIF